MEGRAADYTNTLRALSAAEPPAGELYQDEAFRGWYAAWRARRARQPVPEEEGLALMRASNPAVIPRNHQVERALAAAGQGDLGPVHRLVAALGRPYDEAPEHEEYRRPPGPDERVRATFCGT
jgi:serine/tyrosine/threonine adenylyltransferase